MVFGQQKYDALTPLSRCTWWNAYYQTGFTKNEKHNNDEVLEDFKFHNVSGELKSEKIEDVLIQELRLAALLHDVGHGPLAHKFDDFTLSKHELFKIINGDNDLKQFNDFFKELLEPIKDNGRIDHEVISCVFIIKIIGSLKSALKEKRFSEKPSKLIPQIDVKRILKMIEPKPDSLPPIKINKIDYTPFFSSIISSFPLDADRMDYLYRDSYFSGVNYGYYDISRLLMSFIPINSNNSIYLSIKESGIDAVIRFIQSRTHLFNQVYSHKTNRAANCMLDYACRKIKPPIIKVKNFKQLQDFYWENSDEHFLWNTLKDKITEDKKGTKSLDDLLERKLWKRVYEKKIVITKSITSKDKGVIKKAEEIFKKLS